MQQIQHVTATEKQNNIILLDLNWKIKITQAKTHSCIYTINHQKNQEVVWKVIFDFLKE